MAFNMYKQIPKIKEALKEKGYEENIPVKEVLETLMILFGMKKQTARGWLITFKELKLMTINEYDQINFPGD